MDAVAEVHVQVPGFAPHRRVARRPAHAGVRARVGDLSGAGTVVGLDLGQAHPHGVTVDERGQHAAEEARGDLDGQTGEVFARGCAQRTAHRGGT
jgi:hypothetical protein